ncbi:hypothetical protein L226DRAFT_291867 [Lentinus tigrinus ALCF2SS1-7]|uniref:uncharacterized protein n=1 Tax=Lentinus tigrinus ALCF2SS1-7 TaxID=1328758 RepID=UPI001165F820|nr:hypothetical protein L226DRAFT_291867 [Lentinus tigrinus ALCF2SS1-7]
MSVGGFEVQEPVWSLDFTRNGVVGLVAQPGTTRTAYRTDWRENTGGPCFEWSGVPLACTAGTVPLGQRPHDHEVSILQEKLNVDCSRECSATRTSTIMRRIAHIALTGESQSRLLERRYDIKIPLCAPAVTSSSLSQARFSSASQNFSMTRRRSSGSSPDYHPVRVQGRSKYSHLGRHTERVGASEYKLHVDYVSDERPPAVVRHRHTLTAFVAPGQIRRRCFDGTQT